MMSQDLAIPYLTARNMAKINDIVSRYITYLAYNKPNLASDFKFSMLEEYATTKLTLRDKQFTATISHTHTPTFELKHFTTNDGQPTFKMFSRKTAYQIYQLQSLGWSIDTLVNMPEFRERVLLLVEQAVNTAYRKAKDEDRLTISKETVDLRIDTFRAGFNEQSKNADFNLTAIDSLILSLTNNKTFKRPYVYTHEELNTYLLSCADTYNVLFHEPERVHDMYSILINQVGRRVANMLVSFTYDKTAPFSATLKSQTITDLINHSQSFYFMDFIKEQVPSFEDLAVQLTPDLVVTNEWLRFIELFRRGGGRFKALYADSDVANFTNAEQVLKLYDNYGINECDVTDEQTVYQAFEFRNLIDSLNKINSGLNVEQAQNIVIRPFVKGYAYSNEELALFKAHHIQYFIVAPLTIYKLKETLNIRCLINNISN